MTDMADSGTGSKLFVRQSSGLVRDVSVTNALFFNVAAFVGVGLTLYPIFYSLAFVPVLYEGTVVAEIDVDSDAPAAFGEADRVFLERVANAVSAACLVGWDTGGMDWDAPENWA